MDNWASILGLVGSILGVISTVLSIVFGIKSNKTKNDLEKIKVQYEQERWMIMFEIIKTSLDIKQEKNPQEVILQRITKEQSKKDIKEKINKNTNQKKINGLILKEFLDKNKL